MSNPIRKENRRPRSSRLRFLIALYFLLLLISHGTRLLIPDPTPGAGESSLGLRASKGERTVDRWVDLVYRDHRPADQSDAPALLLIHGSPGRKEDFERLVPTLGDRYRLIIPDLPGFGKSTAGIPDYSIEAHARYLAALLEELKIERVHIVGFSMGGGVGLHLYDLDPERVRSLTLLSAIGVQELELLGEYHVNHLVHGIQLGALLLVHEAFPHMGFLDDAILSVAYARNFYDSDQRPLRGILARYDKPMLIVHGKRDVLVPPAAAVEHHRLVPQSELQMLDTNHFMVFTQGGLTAETIARFIERVELGLASSREDALPERLRAAAEPFDPSAVPLVAGLPLLVMMVLIAAATLASEDLTCVTVGLLAAHGRISFVAGVIACFVGIYVGDLLLYLAGRYLGRAALGHAPLKWMIRPEHVEVSSEWFARRGPVVILLSRFLPGTRLPTYFGAGLLHTSFWSFSFYFILAVALWTPLLVGMSMMLGGEVLRYFELADKYVPLALLLTAVSILLIIKLVIPLFSFRGRRLLVSFWRRKLRWEFWPLWAFYPPVVAYVLWLGLKHRSPLLFTAANPVIEAGGFISESKSEILHGLAASSEFVARTRLLPAAAEPEERLSFAKRFLQAEGLSYPVVLKPNRGQRGSGVAVVRTDGELRRYLENSRFDVIIQEHVAGQEFGLFYYRYPDQVRGRIFSVTEKQMPVMVGDGKQTVEQLILRGRRTVCMARFYLSKHVHDLSKVPSAGEQVQLVELGTHCRGAVFLDGKWIKSRALEGTIDRISRGYPGFYFGRYDIRTPSVEDLKQGHNFKIVELNGVTSEATHIYDPKFRLFAAYRVLFEQWRIAFEIGRQNRMRGARPSGLGELMRLLFAYRRTASLHPE